MSPFSDDPIEYLEALLGECDPNEPNWTPGDADKVDERTYQDLRPFILLVERFLWSSRQAAMMWNAALLCSGNTDKSKLLTATTIRNLRARYGKERIEQFKRKRPYIAIECDGKQVNEPLHHNKKRRINAVTVVGLEIASEDDPEPKVEYAAHFESRETGLALANETCKVIEDTGSKDILLVTKSDGPANNTSPDVGMHKVHDLFSP